MAVGNLIRQFIAGAGGAAGPTNDVRQGTNYTMVDGVDRSFFATASLTLTMPVGTFPLDIRAELGATITFAGQTVEDGSLVGNTSQRYYFVGGQWRFNG